MLKIWLFEMKKITKSLFIFIMLVLLIFIILGYFVFVYVNTVRTDDIIMEIKDRVHLQEQHLEDLNQLDNQEEGQNNTGLKEEIDFQKEYLSKEKDMVEAYRQKDWSTILAKEIKDDEDAGIHSTNKIISYSTFPTAFTTETRYQKNKWLRDRGIPPVLPIGTSSWTTMYDVDFGDKRAEAFVKNQSTKYSSTGINFLSHVFKLLFHYVAPIFFVLLFGNVLTKEGIGKNGPIQLLQTQPIRLYQLLTSKLAATVTITILILLCVSIFSVLMGTIFDRFGNLDYPVLIYETERSYHFITMGVFLLKVFIISMMVLLFCYSLLFFFSVITRNTLSAVGLTILVIFITHQWNEGFAESLTFSFTPFSYFSVTKVVTNELAVTLNNEYFTYPTGLIILGSYSIIFFLASYFILLKRSNAKK
ncbi:ABC transporter permease [Virgibacillus sp. Bac330]|uniref:ABC transporter permease n=1 Tax=Virgibacillus sp. Bac330 TaxID=2419841 RepID=UPI000EF50B76|nr:ABC transporter permease subunit [Virgibacillus sp. Bac330]